MDKPQSDNWITTDEAAIYMRITPRAARYNAEEGKLGEIREESGRRGRGGKNILLRPENLPAAAYLRYYTAKNQPGPAGELGPEWERATQAQKERAVFIHQRLIAWQSYRQNDNGAKGDLDRQFIAAWRQLHPEDKISRPTLYLDWNKYQYGGLGGLVYQHGIKRRGQLVIDPEAKTTLEALYCKPSRPSIAHCIEQLRTINMLENKNWQLPSSKRSFERIIAALDDTVKTRAREGVTAFNNQHGVYIMRDYDTLEVMQLWQSDHQEQDFFVRGPHGEIARPWQTVWMDARSRYVVGWHCSMGGDTDTIMAGFADGSLKNGAVVPPHLSIDNGRDYAGRRFTNGCHKFRKIDESKVKAMTQHLGITVHYCIPENPQAKHIERVFRTLREYFDKYQPTYTGNEAKKRPETAEEARKAGQVMNWDEYVQASADAWLYYNTRPHSGKGMNGKSPLQVFNEGLERVQVRWVSPESLKYLMWRTSDTRKVRRDGIEIDKRWYSSLTLLDHQGEEVYARYSPYSDTVYIFDLKDTPICEATLEGKSAWLGDQETLKQKMQIRRSHAKRVDEKLQNIRAQADPTALDEKALFANQTELARRRAAEIEQKAPKVIEPVRTPFDAIAKTALKAETAKVNVKAKSVPPPQREADPLVEFMRARRQMAVGAEDQSPADKRQEIRDSFEMLKRGLKKMEMNGGN